jgi:hypothetical protein
MKKDKWSKIFEAFGSGDQITQDKKVESTPKEVPTDTSTGWIDISQTETKEMGIYGLQKDGILTSHMLIIMPIEGTSDEQEFFHVVHEMHDNGEVFGGYKILTKKRIKELFQIDVKSNSGKSNKIMPNDIIGKLSTYLFKNRDLITTDVSLKDGVSTIQSMIKNFFNELRAGKI